MSRAALVVGLHVAAVAGRSDRPRCGDAECSALEDHVLCPSDCAAP